HHLLKTFWDGWGEHQSPDGTLTLTTPTGHVYRTKPFSALLFPSWNTTGEPPPATGMTVPPRTPGRELMMPTRRRTRAQTRAAYITRERELNAVHRELDRAAVAEVSGKHRRNRPEQVIADVIRRSLDRPPGYRPDYRDDPPPF
ncbi:MAG: HNH endonuclease, partial [Actinomycetota bacterium]|nr:HNH endonuclease [Actinomycetota bacterium]